MSRAYIQTSKLGDIVSILPCLHQDFVETGEKANLIVCKRYSGLVEGLEYINPVIWNGDWDDVPGALLWAKSNYKEVIVPQMFSKTYLPRRAHPGFQLDQWHRCGRLGQWGDLTLPYPKGVSPLQGRMILVGDRSESSPFAHIEDLVSTLTAEFPEHKIVRLSNHILPFPDLLALYDTADLIVAIDSFHAHFSMASKTPAIVLATDKPSRWHGASYHPRMVAQIRYGDYELKKEQLFHLAKLAVNKSVFPVVRKESTVHGFGYNLSMMRVRDKLWKTYRYHPEASWRTVLSLIHDGNEFPVKVPSKYERFSIEDGRLFMFQGKPHISVTVARSRMPGMNFDPCIQAFGELQPDGAITNWVEPKVGRNDWTAQEKNWTYHDYGGKLHVCYSHSPAHVVHEISKVGHIINTYKTPTPVCSFGEPRGGTQLVSYKGNLLKFFHANQVNLKSDAKQNYHVGAMVMEAHPPFRITKISKQPILSGNELWSPAPFWKAKCVLPYGVLENSGAWEVSIGRNDCECAIAMIWPENLNL